MRGTQDQQSSKFDTGPTPTKVGFAATMNIEHCRTRTSRSVPSKITPVGARTPAKKNSAEFADFQRPSKTPLPQGSTRWRKSQWQQKNEAQAMLR
ncbi:hypothetical protein BSKO_07094 [Bryopsis sp. KO-2023]|nr:hypothetical protein BSKO_07094 [Bryopsis sp. KO-2023]